jgi:hypothetical protein
MFEAIFAQDDIFLFLEVYSRVVMPRAFILR